MLGYQRAILNQMQCQTFRTWPNRNTGTCQCRSKGSSYRLPSFHRGHVACNAAPDDGPSTSGQSSSGPKPNLSDPVQMVNWGATLPNPRRAVVGGLLGAVVAIGGNLGGITSGLLSLDGGKTAADLRLDVIIPVKGIKRFVDYQDGFEFTYPAAWLADQTLLRRAAQRAEQDRSNLQFMSKAQREAERARTRQRAAVEPTIAVGPAGSSGEKNVSVIVAPIYEGFELSSLGSAESSAQRFLSTIAPEGSGRNAKLLGASQRVTAGELYYEMEYTIEGPNFYRHNISAYVSRNNTLYTLNAQCPEATWQQDQADLRGAAASFRLISGAGQGAGAAYPGRL